MDRRAPVDFAGFDVVNRRNDPKFALFERFDDHRAVFEKFFDRDVNVFDDRRFDQRGAGKFRTGGANALHRRFDVRNERLNVPVGVFVFDRRRYRAALRVSQDDQNRRAEVRNAVFDRAGFVVGANAARDANDENVAKTLVEEKLDRNAGVAATENRRERMLAVFRGVNETGEVRVRVRGFVRGETFVALNEKAERLFGGNAGARVASDGANGNGEEKGESEERKRDAFHWVKFLIVGVKGRRVGLRRGVPETNATSGTT